MALLIRRVHPLSLSGTFIEMNIRTYILLIGIYSLMSCDSLYEDMETQYVIPKGAHEAVIAGGSTGLMRTMKSDELLFTARFDETARYIVEGADQQDINKLMGFSDANEHHHQYSIRFGWRYDLESDNIEIFTYSYKDGQLTHDYIRDVEIGETHLYSIALSGENYLLSIDSEEPKIVERGMKRKRGIYYLMFPYFGGNVPAPHQINVFINEQH